MNPLIRLIYVGCACVVLHACSTARPSPPPAATAAVAPSSISAPATGAPPSGITAGAQPNRIVLEDKTLTNDEVKALFAQGYKPVGRNGEVYYCRREQQTGSRFATMTCKTADQMKQIAQDGKELLSAKQKPGGCATQGPGC